MRRQIVAGAAFVAAAAWFGSEAAEESGARQGMQRFDLPVHTVAEVGGDISAFAQDGPRVAWLARASTRCGTSLVVRDLATRRQVELAGRVGLCSNEGNVLALAGDRVVYAELLGSGMSEAGGRLMTAAVHDRHGRVVCTYVFPRDEGYTMIARGDHATSLAFGSYEPVAGQAGCLALWRIDAAGHAKRLLKVPPDAAAVVGNRLATVTNTYGVNASYALVVRALSGQSIRRISDHGTATDIALSPARAAVLVSYRGRYELRLYATASGKRLWATRAPLAPTQLSIARNAIVFSAKRTIWATDATSGQTRRLATTPTIPIGLSVEGRRVAWGENVAGSSRIRALYLRG